MNMDEKTHFQFMGIMSEMVVMYYDHTYCGHRPNGGSEGAFRLFCRSITRYLDETPTVSAKGSESQEEIFIAWLMLELEMEFGLSEELAAQILVGFFVDSYYHDIYRTQKVVNDYLFPNGYYNRRRNFNI